MLSNHHPGCTQSSLPSCHDLTICFRVMKHDYDNIDMVHQISHYKFWMTSALLYEMTELRNRSALGKEPRAVWSRKCWDGIAVPHENDCHG